MATYYKWRRSTVGYTETSTTIPGGTSVGIFSSKTIYYSDSKPTINQGGFYNWNPSSMTSSDNPTPRSIRGYLADALYTDTVYTSAEPYPNDDLIWYPDTGNVVAQDNVATIKYTLVKGPGTFVDYVYSTSSSAYPNGGARGSYYYDQRTTVTSPTAASGLTYPATITTSSVNISWTAATSNVPNYTVNQYEVSYSTNGGSGWTVAGTTAETSYSFDIPAGTTSILFRVRAKDSNNQYGAYVTGTASQVLLSPTLTVPQMVMQGQSATISWSAVEGADSYTLQRKSSADADWTQVYSWANLSYTETVGTWTSLQYRVQAVFDETPGGWATSGDIQIVAASTLVISGTDGDLGTLTSDVQYSISSDQTSPTIDVAVEVNGGEYAEFTATSGQTYSVGVLDLPTGTGSIVITATTTVSSSPVTVTRTWTYSKTAQTFHNSGSVATLTQEGNVVYPETLAEAVRAGTPWGGNLSTALELLKKAALYNRTQTPKYSEVAINLATATVGQIINLPVNGVMTPHRVVHIGNPDPELYDASCDGVWMWRLDAGESGAWNTADSNVLPNSTIMQAMAAELSDYDSAIQSAVKTVKIPYCVGGNSSTVNSGANGLECKMFPLGCYEVGFTDVNNLCIPEDGVKLSYFEEGRNTSANNKRIARLQGINHRYWTRSSYYGGTADLGVAAHGVSEIGDIDPDGVEVEKAYCTAFLLPTTFTAGPYYVDNQGTIHASQEYTPAGDWLDVWGNAIPAVRIETGSYVGTGTSGQSNPTSLTFSFVPKIVFIMKDPVPDLNQMGMGLFLCDSLGTEYKNRGYMYAYRGYSYTSQDTALNFPPNAAAAQAKIEGNTLSWWSNEINFQLNTNTAIYHYVALG